METGVIVVIGLSVISAVGLTFSIREDWWQSGIGSRLWNLAETSIGLFLMIAMLYTAATQVIVRYAFSEYLIVPWTEELSRLFLVWVAFWGAGMVQRSDSHIAVAIFYDLLGLRARVLVRLLGDAATLAFLAIVVWQGWLAAQLQLGISMISLQLPSALYAFSVPICAAVMVAHTILLMVRRSQMMSSESTSGPGV